MKRSNFIIIAAFLISIFTLCGAANAYWIWTPQTKKFINPKYAVKDSPKEQYNWAMSFYDAKDFQRSATEFEKLAKQYEFSEYASKAQYYVGLCYENMGKYYIAFQNYQKAIDNFPHIANTDEILAREFAIGNIYLGKASPKVLGTDIMAPLDRAVEIFKKVVENAPYGKHAEEAQFRLGEALKKSERYEEAVTAFHKIVEDYPNSKLTTQAMYEESNCAYKASLRPAYDASATDNAIKTFEKFTYKNKDAGLAESATTTMKRLKDNVSEKSFRAAEFYEAQGKIQAAMIYYQDVIDSYPDGIFTDRAKARIDALKVKGNKDESVDIKK
ncbi:MAG: tetratricopeptide repeat protein [Candidatus Omnitrophota bacterium]|nr:tetratricopeptide repeat protein [Candidatus Omnitrophota bacterium]